MRENAITLEKNILLHPEQPVSLDDENNELTQVMTEFAGLVVKSVDEFNLVNKKRGSALYFAGDTTLLNELDLECIRNIYVITEFSCNAISSCKNRFMEWISISAVPVSVHGVGVFFKRLFGDVDSYFSKITEEHAFQSLTESNKPGLARRKGIYMTSVKENGDQKEFKLLRCSSNFSGPTDNYRATDHKIVGKVNEVSAPCFRDEFELNHTLAQIYENSLEDTENGVKERKAKIKRHSDKTKDMPIGGLIAFCTFYKDYVGGKFTDPKLDHLQPTDEDKYEYAHKKVTGLTKLRFQLKDAVYNGPNNDTYTKRFDVTLYPNSVFVIPLVTNRLYTHEIIPSSLPIDKIPTRMGYVIRCSNKDAVHRDGKTFLVEPDISVDRKRLVLLVKPDTDGMNRLRELYFKENTGIELVNYDGFYFSMNKGDYEEPLL